MNESGMASKLPVSRRRGAMYYPKEVMSNGQQANSHAEQCNFIGKWFNIYKFLMWTPFKFSRLNSGVYKIKILKLSSILEC